jgi:hypothetical protein
MPPIDPLWFVKTVPSWKNVIAPFLSISLLLLLVL